MENTNANAAAMPEGQTAQMPKINGWYLAMGIFLVFAGISALVSPVATTLITNVFIGWFLVFGGIIQFFAAIVNRKDGGMWVGMFMGVLAVILGYMMVSNVAASIISITLLMGIFFGIDGLVKSFQSVLKRPAHWGWMLTSGIISIILSLMIFMNFFVSSTMMLGIFAGIYMLFAGIDIIVLYFASK